MDELPREQHAQVLNVMRAAWKLTDAEEAIKRLEGLARFLEHEYESAARRTGNVTRWRNAAMVERWVTSAWLLTEKRFRKVIGHEHLWTLAVNLGREETQRAAAQVA